YDSVSNPMEFADLLTRHLRDVSQDPHLLVSYTVAPMPDRPSGSTPVEDQAAYRNYMHEQNCTFGKAQTLPANIGYLKFDSFPDPEVCTTQASDAILSLNRNRAVILDLRENGGGHPEMVTFLAGHFFKQPTHLNDMHNRYRNETEEFWTSPVAAS